MAQYQSEIGDDSGRRSRHTRQGVRQLSAGELRQVRREYGEFMAPKLANARASRMSICARSAACGRSSRSCGSALPARRAMRSRWTQSDPMRTWYWRCTTWVPVRSPRVTVTKAKVDINDEGAFQAWQMSGSRTVGKSGRPLSFAQPGGADGGPDGANVAADAADAADAAGGESSGARRPGRRRRQWIIRMSLPP